MLNLNYGVIVQHEALQKHRRQNEAETHSISYSVIGREAIFTIKIGHFFKLNFYFRKPLKIDYIIAFFFHTIMKSYTSPQRTG